MKTYVIFYFGFFSFNLLISQAYVCPTDTTATFLDLALSDQFHTVEILDTDYGYNYTSRTITKCEGDTMGFVDYTYYIFKDAQPVDTCYQRITILVYDIDDIDPILPRDTIIEEASYTDVHPDNINNSLGNYGFGNLFGFQDSITVEQEGSGASITRTWLIPIPCTADEIITHIQLITINNYIITDDSSGIVNINAEDISVDSILVSTEGSRINCGITTTIMELKDCICSNADIEDDEVITLKIMKGGIDIDGVSTLDLVYTMRYILKIPPSLEPYAFLACDVNEDNKITTLDALLMRRLILGMIEDFPGDNNWKFIYPGQSDQSENGNIIISKSDLCNGNIKIIAIKKGDVNGTASGL